MEELIKLQKIDENEFGNTTVPSTLSLSLLVYSISFVTFSFLFEAKFIFLKNLYFLPSRHSIVDLLQFEMHILNTFEFYIRNTTYN